MPLGGQRAGRESGLSPESGLSRNRGSPGIGALPERHSHHRPPQASDCPLPRDRRLNSQMPQPDTGHVTRTGRVPLECPPTGPCHTVSLLTTSVFRLLTARSQPPHGPFLTFRTWTGQWLWSSWPCWVLCAISGQGLGHTHLQFRPAPGRPEPAPGRHCLIGQEPPPTWRPDRSSQPFPPHPPLPPPREFKARPALPSHCALVSRGPALLLGSQANTGPQASGLCHSGPRTLLPAALTSCGPRSAGQLPACRGEEVMAVGVALGVSCWEEHRLRVVVGWRCQV